jgi:hypothetical protein
VLSPKLEARLGRSSDKSSSQKLKLDLHAKQLQVHHSLQRFRVVCCGRRFGKSRLGLTEIIKFALTYQGDYDPASPPVIVVGMPNLPMAKRVFFTPLCNLLKGHPLVEQIDKANTLIRLRGNRPDIICLGLNDGFGDRVRGLRIAFFVGDEIQAVKRGILDEVIIPAMSDTRGSRALITGTPKGKLNHLWDLTQRSKTLEDWGYFHFFTSDNPFVGREEVARAKATLDPRTYRQEYEASFEDFAGKIFSELSDRHYIDVLPDSFDRTYLGIDWGDTNPALVVIGLKGDRYYVVDEWINTTGQTLPLDVLEENAVRLCEKWNVHRGYADPSRPSSILGFRGLAHDGLKRTIKGFNRIEEGLTTINSLFFQNRLFIYSKLAHFKQCAESYHRATDAEGNVLPRVEDGQDDHSIDAFRYVLATIEVNKILKVA